jgi:hypothetical protein
MALFHRRDRPPPEVVAQLPRDERVVSWADLAGGGVLLATPRGLWWPEPDGSPRLIGWQYITKAIWRDNHVIVTEADVVDDFLLVDRPPVAVEIAVPRDLPPAIRKRVEANVVRSEVLQVVGGAARFVARRVPGRDGVTWWARLEGATPDAPEVRESVRARLAALQASD